MLDLALTVYVVHVGCMKWPAGRRTRGGRWAVGVPGGKRRLKKRREEHRRVVELH